MSTLKEKAEQILQEKEEKIIPENFGENLEIFDVTGGIKDLSDAREVFTKITLGAENLDMTSQSGNMLIKNIELDYNINDKVILSKSSPIAHIVTKEAIAEAIDLTADKLKKGETILGVEGTAEGIDTSDATATENDIVAGKSAYIDGELVYGNIEVPKSSGYNNTYLDGIAAEKGGGNTVVFTGKASLYDRVVIDRGIDVSLWVSEAEVRELIGGTDTSDATAVAGDLAMGKTAYVNGSKIVGTIPVYSEYAYKLMTPSVKDLGPNNTVTILGTMDIDKSVLLKPNASVELAVPQSSIASTAGLVANKIKLGETILGVTGTFQGEGVSKIHINYSNTIITVHCGVIVDMLMSAINEGVITLNDKLDIASSGLSPVCLRLCDVEPSGDSSIVPGYIGLAINLDDVATCLVYIDGNQSKHLLGAVDEYGSASEYSLTMTVNNLVRILSNLGDIEIRFSHEELEEADVYNEFVTTFYEFLNASGGTVNRGKLQANSDTMTISEV